MRGTEPGTTCKLWYDPAPDLGEPEEGDLVATPAGACYLVEGVSRSKKHPNRFYLTCERLPRNSVAIGDEGVWPLYWYQRGAR